MFLILSLSYSSGNDIVRNFHQIENNITNTNQNTDYSSIAASDTSGEEETQISMVKLPYEIIAIEEKSFYSLHLFLPAKLNYSIWLPPDACRN
ncbi:MAG: hypothetical protein HC905_30685 [Bacteroidales bacterium]|nr:hypothetical protein [Bacteroidales bacterium]